MLIISVSLGIGSLISHLVVYSECFKDFSTWYKFYVKSLNSMFSLYILLLVVFMHKPLYWDQNPYKKILDLDLTADLMTHFRIQNIGTNWACKVDWCCPEEMRDFPLIIYSIPLLFSITRILIYQILSIIRNFPDRSWSEIDKPQFTVYLLLSFCSYAFCCHGYQINSCF